MKLSESPEICDQRACAHNSGIRKPAIRVEPRDERPLHLPFVVEVRGVFYLPRKMTGKARIEEKRDYLTRKENAE